MSKLPKTHRLNENGMFNKYLERFALSCGRERDRASFGGNSKAPTVGMPWWQVSLQKGLCENPVGARALQSSPPAQTWPTLLPQSVTRSPLESAFDSTDYTINYVQNNVHHKNMA